MNQNRNQALDGLRAYAAIAVVFFHAILFFRADYNYKILNTPLLHIFRGTDIQSKILMTFFNGQLAVAIFFVLSGVVLFRFLDKSTQQGFFTTIINFTLKRMTRIYFPMIIYLLIFFSLFLILQYLPFPNFYHLFHLFSFKNLINNMILYNSSLSAQTWTLYVEIVAVPFILMAFYCYRLLGSLGLFIFLAYALLSLRYPWLTFNIFLINGYLFLFALGFFIPTQVGKKIFSFFKGSYCIFFFFLTILVRQIDPRQEPFLIFGQGVAIFFFVGTLYHHSTGLVHKFLMNKYSLYLGKISYSLYLYNWMFLVLIERFMMFYAWPFKFYFKAGLLLGLVVTVITIPLAHLSEKYIERPSRNFKFITRRAAKTYSLAVE